MSLEKARAALQTANYIDGAWIKPEKTFDVVSGATGAVFAQCPLATAEMAADAAKAASAAFKTWGKTPAAERAGWLMCVSRGRRELAGCLFSHFARATLSPRYSARSAPPPSPFSRSKLADELEKRKEEVAR
jgi:acyl-CoA reductase-like NAD-dependent aldehyde dehydrogenase